jgi:replicative DNA helicase
MIAIEAEQALIGACLLNVEIIDLIDGMLCPEDFGEPVHVTLFDTMVRGRREGRRIDPKILMSLLGSDAKADLPGTGMTVGAYIARLAAEATTTINARDFARIVAEYSGYRRLTAAASMLTERSAVANVGGSPAEIAADAIDELDAIVSDSTPSSVRRMSIGEAAKYAVENLNDVRVNGSSKGVTWGLADLDRATLGMRPGQLIVLAARPSMGKTSVGVSTALAAARAHHGVMFASLEMGAQELAERALSDICYSSGCRVPYSAIVAGDIENTDMDAVVEAAETLKHLPISIEQQGGLSVSQIASRARSLRTKWERRNQPLDLLIVDHLGLMQASQRYAGQRHAEVSEITGSLKALAKQMGIPILLLCQLNRAVESRENKRPQLADLRDSGRIEEDADTVIMLYRESYYLERQTEDDAGAELERSTRLELVRNRLEIIIAKQRQGPTKTVNAFVSMAHNAVRNLEQRAFAV